MNSNNLLYKSQYGFRSLHSTELASLEIVDIITQDLDQGKLPLGVFLDLSKAFDTLDHSILLNKLNYYGVKGCALAWFQSYLTNRVQYVEYDNTQSSMLPITTGVPQGSILGPLLFIIYMNDIHEASNKFHAILFADDSNLTSTLCSFNVSLTDTSYNKTQLSNNINKELQAIQIWLEINKLSLNVKKTKFMVFHHRQRNISNFIPDVEINGQAIECVTEFIFLGLTLDENLSWNAHIQKISNKVSRSLGVIRRLKRFLPSHILRLLYNSLILPHLQYATLTWGFKTSRLAQLQKRAIRIISLSKYNAHTEPIFKQLKLLKLEDIFKTKALIFYYKFKQNTIPAYFKSMFISEQHSYETRHKNELQPPRVKTAFAQRCIRYFVPDLLKKTPPCITEKVLTHSQQGFSKYIKNNFINEYKGSCNIVNCYIGQNK